MIDGPLVTDILWQASPYHPRGADYDSRRATQTGQETAPVAQPPLVKYLD